MKILIVEDNLSHISEAVKVLKEAGIEIETALDETEGISILKSGIPEISRVDGAIIDIFMPHSSTPPWNTDNEPCGLAVALRAEQLNIPFVFCTAGYHHGARYDWICEIVFARDWPDIIDSPVEGENIYHAENSSKNWKKALEVLVEIISSKKK